MITSESGLESTQNGSSFNEVEGNVSSRLLIYPNPATQAIQMELPESLDKEAMATIEIYGMTGGLVYSELTQVKTIKQNTLDISILTSGVYQIRVNSLGGYTTGILVVD